MKLSSILPRLFATAALFISILSCSENLDSSGVCPVLCPQIGGDVQNVTLDGAIELDTTVQSLSGTACEISIWLRPVVLETSGSSQNLCPPSS